MRNGDVLLPGDVGYDELIAPWNSVADYTPAFVARPCDADALARVIADAATSGLRVAVQSSGHGAAGRLGGDVALISTANLQSVEIDPVARTASIGAGATWGVVASEAVALGLAGLAGTSPTVGVAGYLMSGGLGWLTRRHGLASATLLAVDYVDAEGAPRRTDERNDPEVLWSFRGGGGGVGVATRLSVRLFEHRTVYAGTRFWAIDRLPEVLERWMTWTEHVPPAVTSMCWALQAPPGPGLPGPLRGRAVVAIGACVTDDESASVVQSCFAGLAEPLLDTFSQRSPDSLRDLHMDPPGPMAILGDGRLIDRPSPGDALAAFQASGIEAQGPLTIVELRHLGAAAQDNEELGALTALDGEFTLGTSGVASTAELRAAVSEQIDAVMEAAGDVDRGVGLASMRVGQTQTLDALRRQSADRLLRLRSQRDPGGRFRPAMSLLS